jgi:autotransporter translocation and assembly factor TamB
MKRTRRRRWWGAGAIALLCILTLALWQWQALARLAIIAGVEATMHVRVAFAQSNLSTSHLSLRDVRVTSFRNEPIAEIAQFDIAYDLRDLIAGGTRRFGLKAVDVESPHVTIIRRPDGSYNVPLPNLQANGAGGGPPLVARVRLRNGELDVIDEGRTALRSQRHLFVRDVQVVADISTAHHSTYAVNLRYGEAASSLFPVQGAGTIDFPDRYVDQRWSAAELPVAGAVDFAANSPAFRLLSGTLRDVDVRDFGIADANGSLAAHLAGAARLTGASISIAGLSQPITGVRGPIDMYDNGLLTPRLDAAVAGVPARVSGGIYGLKAPQMRVAVRGDGDLSQLRAAFGPARRLPMKGPLRFALLAEGPAAKPVVWINLRSPQTTYAATTLDHLNGALAYDGREIQILRFRANYRNATIATRGRIAIVKEPNAIEMLVNVRAPGNGAPYVSEVLPNLPLNAIALATANDPNAISMRGALWGDGEAEHVSAIFNVDSRGVGSIGPIEAESGAGSLYARIALDHTHRADYGLVEAENFPIPPARALLTASLYGERSDQVIRLDGVARAAGAWGTANGQGTVGYQRGFLRGSLFGNLANEADVGATVSGTPRAPRVAGTVVVAGGRYRNFAVNGNAAFVYDRDTVHLHDTALAIGPLFLGLAGTIKGVLPHGTFSPRYDLAAQVHSSDVATLMAAVQPRAAALVEGSVDANLALRGAGTMPHFSGTIDAPEGSVNGLAFRDLHAAVAGDMDALSVMGGRVVVGSSPISVEGIASPDSADVAIEAPHLDLTDFNDFFDTGDTFAGSGSLALRARIDRRQIAASSGKASFSDARFRRVDLGTVAARWTSAGGSIQSSLRFGGPSGIMTIAGTVVPAQKQVALTATATGLDLSTWLPMLGLNEPITGHLNAQTSLSGTYPDIAMRLHAAVYDGTAGPLPIERFEVVASASNGHGRIDSAVLDVPSLSNVASGTFGLRMGDPIAVTVQSTSANIGDFLKIASGKQIPIRGSFASTLRVEGTAQNPRLRDSIALEALQYRNLTIARVAGEIDADRRSVALRNGEADLDRGKALLSGTMPIALTQTGIHAGSGPVSGALLADDVELSNFAPLLPKGSQLRGRINGRLDATGTRQAPNLTGTLTLRDGIFDGPIEKSPITGIAADLAFAGDRARLQSHAFVGGGAITASGFGSLADLSRPATATFTVEGEAQNARFDIPEYFQGNVDGNVTIARTQSSIPAVGGDLSIYNARIPIDAFLKQKAAGGGPSSFNVAFDDFSIAAGSNVRVQSANVDVGATGAVRLGGTLATPTLSGAFHSTGGSLSFYRSFNLERGDVSFDPSAGVIPDINAVATTFVPDPATAVRLHVTGAATNMNLNLESDPPYSKEQILGLLVGAQQFGAVRGVQSTGSSRVTAGSAVAGVAFGQLNTVFTRNILEPLNASLGSGLGFTEVQITSDIQTGLGVNAVKAFGKYVNAIWSQSFGYPKTSAIGLEAHPNAATGLRLTAYSSQGPTLFALQQQPQPIDAGVLDLNPLTAYTPISGENGVTFVYQRKFP